MIRGLLFRFEFPLAHFSTEDITADLLYPIIWEGIRLVESMGLKVIAVTADGASPNIENGDVYQSNNVYASDERYVYFISDPPHLIKTARNCLSHSHVNSHSRSLRVSHRIKYLHVLDCLCCALHKLQCSCPLAKDMYEVW